MHLLRRRSIILGGNDWGTVCGESMGAPGRPAAQPSEDGRIVLRKMDRRVLLLWN